MLGEQTPPMGHWSGSKNRVHPNSCLCTWGHLVKWNTVSQASWKCPLVLFRRVKVKVKSNPSPPLDGGSRERDLVSLPLYLVPLACMPALTAPEEPVLGIPLPILCMSRHVKTFVILSGFSLSPPVSQLITAILKVRGHMCHPNSGKVW